MFRLRASASGTCTQPKVIFGLALDRDVLGNKKRENVLKGKNYFFGTDALQNMYRRKVLSECLSAVGF